MDFQIEYSSLNITGDSNSSTVLSHQVRNLSRIDRWVRPNRGVKLSELIWKEKVNFTTWDIDGPFDYLLNDRFNFGLEDESHAILSSVLTGGIMIILSDLFLRICIRGQGSIISTHIVQRRYLINSATNPLEWIPLISEFFQSFFAKRGIAESQNASSVPRSSSSIQESKRKMISKEAIFIVSMAFFLLSTDLLILFLGTTREYAVSIDRSKMPAFSLKQRNGKFISDFEAQSCVSYPMTQKPGFFARYKFNICSNVPSRFETVSSLAQVKTIPVIALFQVGYRLFLITQLNDVTLRSNPQVQIPLNNGTLYRVLSNISSIDALRVLNHSLNDWGYPILTHFIFNRDSGNGLLQGDDWVVYGLVNNVGKDLPFQVPDENIGGLREGLETSWCRLFLGIASGLLTTEASNRAFLGSPENGTFLDEMSMEEPIVKRRPWMSLGATIILMAIVFVLWMIAAFFLKWTTGGDERLGFIPLSPNFADLKYFELHFPSQRMRIPDNLESVPITLDEGPK